MFGEIATSCFCVLTTRSTSAEISAAGCGLSHGHGLSFHVIKIKHDSVKVAPSYLDVKVAFKALDEDDEGTRQVVPGGRLDGLACIFWSCPNQEALKERRVKGRH